MTEVALSEIFGYTLGRVGATNDVSCHAMYIVTEVRAPQIL